MFMQNSENFSKLDIDPTNPRHGYYTKWPFIDMSVGDSIDYFDNLERTRGATKACNARIPIRYGKKFKLMVRKIVVNDDVGVRVTRIE